MLYRLGCSDVLLHVGLWARCCTRRISSMVQGGGREKELTSILDTRFEVATHCLDDRVLHNRGLQRQHNLYVNK